MSGRTYRVWLDQWEIQELTSIVSGGVNIDLSTVLKYPQPAVPPWNRLEVNRSSTNSFTSDDTEQQSIVISGVFGFPGRAVARGALESSVADSTTTTVDVTDGRIEVGHALLVDDEYLQVVERSPLDTGQNIGVDLDDSPGSDIVAVADGTGFVRGETILVGSERMWIRDVVGNTLAVRRATDGSTISAHTNGADAYSFRRLTVDRGVWGTTAAGHSDASNVSVYIPPPLIQTLARGEAEMILLQEASGWARTSGSGDNERETGGRGLRNLWAEACAAYGRLRSYAI
jgi:hypothetical protein